MLTRKVCDRRFVVLESLLMIEVAGRRDGKEAACFTAGEVIQVCV